MRYLGVVAVIIALAAVPGTAFAQGSQCQTYNPQTCQSTISSRPPSNTGTLPFTGLDLVLLVGGSATLLSAGFVLRWLSSRLN